MGDPWYLKVHVLVLFTLMPVIQGLGVTLSNVASTKWPDHGIFINSFSSTLKELLAVKYVLISLIDKLSGFSVKWFTDNRNVALILNIESKKPHSQHEILQIFNICYPRSIGIDIEWIPRTENEQSDHLSKMYDDNDWNIANI